MISRVAEHCYWFARYLERAENTARILEVNSTLLLDFQVPVEQQWRPMLIITGILDSLNPEDGETVQTHMTWDAENPASIVSCMTAARENARIIREVISAEVWERINHFHLWLRSAAARGLYEAARVEFYNQIRVINQLVNGVADATMLHGEAWEFFRLGRYLERASQTARILDVKYHMLLPKPDDVGSPVDNAHWVAILMSCSGYEPFHKTPRGVARDTGLDVAEFLLFDPLFPRSVAFCLRECRRAAGAIAGPGASHAVAEQSMLRLSEWLSERDVGALVAAGLHESLTNVVDQVHEIGEAIRTTYFEATYPAPAGATGE